MVEQTYTIKPLVWEHARTELPMVNRDVWTASSASLVCQVSKDDGDNFHRWYFYDDNDTDGVVSKSGTAQTLEAAKLAAESAYRKLIEEHLNAI